MPRDSENDDAGAPTHVAPGRSRLPQAGSLLLTAVLIALVAFHAFTFRVNPDELGVVMRFGEVSRQEPPGLHFRLPYPIEEVRLPNVTRQNVIEIGMRTDAVARDGPGRSSAVRNESLMLTADENIIDVIFVVFWRIREAQSYLFNIRDPEETVREVAESVMREIVGQSNLQPMPTSARQQTEESAQRLMQDVLNRYRAGIQIDHVRLQRIDPPAQVIDAFRDVQAAATDKETLQNEALAYASRIVPEARGDADRILEGAKGYQQQSIAEAAGQTYRFLKIHTEYKKAPDVTRTRIYLETMERVLGAAEKIIISKNSGVMPFLSLAPAARRQERGN